MRSVTHFLRCSSLKCSKQTFTVRSAIVNYFTSLFSPQRRTGKLKKNSLSCGIFHSLLVAFRYSKTRRHIPVLQVFTWSVHQDPFGMLYGSAGAVHPCLRDICSSSGWAPFFQVAYVFEDPSHDGTDSLSKPLTFGLVAIFCAISSTALATAPKNLVLSEVFCNWGAPSSFW